MKQRVYRIVLMICLAICGINAVVASILMLISPDGNKIGLNTRMLQDIELFKPLFSNYFFPGFLLLILGVLQLSAFAFIWLQQLLKKIISICAVLYFTGWMIGQWLLIGISEPVQFVFVALAATEILCLFMWNFRKAS